MQSTALAVPSNDQQLGATRAVLWLDTACRSKPQTSTLSPSERMYHHYQRHHVLPLLPAPPPHLHLHPEQHHGVPASHVGQLHRMGI
jgi:hypothetical protein